MCGIAGLASLDSKPIDGLERSLAAMGRLIAHRGPDGAGFWAHPGRHAGLAHRRLSIIDLSEAASQPMRSPSGNWIAYNGEIYNYIELRQTLSGSYRFKTSSDTEVILAAYEKWGDDCVSHFRGMFAFALWDERNSRLFCARDRFGIKPFYYIKTGSLFAFASEPKALLPFLGSIETDIDGFREYLSFQFCLKERTLFKGVSSLVPGHCLSFSSGELRVSKYWEVYYKLDWEHTEKYFEEQISSLLDESCRFHLRSDVPVGAYLSGGLDSSAVAAFAKKHAPGQMNGFTGKFTSHPGYDESSYAKDFADLHGMPHYEADISSKDFVDNIEKVVYHLDSPVAGPGSFPQYMVSKLVSTRNKVVLGGQGGDEIFGGYTRYLIAYFEQCIKGAVNGTSHSGNFVVTYESIIPNLVSLRNYVPMLKTFWSEGLFDSIDKRYFRLVNRAPDLSDEIRWSLLGDYSPFDTFSSIFNCDNVEKHSYFDLMTHFDFKTLLPALLQVEDRMSMAHGVESRVPFLDHALIECAATIPSNAKFKNGEGKYILKKAVGRHLPKSIMERKDKMGFPVPLSEWLASDVKGFASDIFSSQAALSRELVDNRKVLDRLGKEQKYARRIWGLLSLELWQRQFHDKAASFKAELAKELSAEEARLFRSGAFA